MKALYKVTAQLDNNQVLSIIWETVYNSEYGDMSHNIIVDNRHINLDLNAIIEWAQYAHIEGGLLSHSENNDNDYFGEGFDKLTLEVIEL